MSVAVRSTEPQYAVPPFEVAGPDAAPALVVLGGISSNRHVCSHAANPSPGWWDGVAGSGRALDTRRYRVVSFDYVDGGSDARARPRRRITTHDQADALARVLDSAAIRRVHAFIGASYGGMVALAFAERHPDRVNHLIVIGAAHASHPMTTARRALQRRIVELGIDTGRAADGLALARALAMTTYRSATEFAERFASAPLLSGRASARFPVERYLEHHGARFAAEWQPARFLALSLSGDLHAVEPSRVHTPATLIAFDDDSIVPRVQMEELAARLGGPSTLHVLPTRHGHDAFLTEPGLIGPILTAALEGIRS